MVDDRPGIANELIKALRRHDTVAVGINVDAMGGARGLAVDGHAKRTGLPSAAGPRTRCRSRAWKR